MKLAILLPILVVMLALRFLKVRMLVWLAAWWLGIFCLLHYGFATPIPISVLKLYMGIVTGALAAYVLADSGRVREVVEPLTRFMVEPRYRLPLVGVMLAIPALVALQIYAGMTTTPKPPVFGRTVHPAPPDQIEVHGTAVALGTADNPFRELEKSNPTEFSQRVGEGRQLYYKNCFYCHGDIMAGDGMFAHGLNPIPTNFQDPGTIAMLREAFLFWRIAKGGPGLPEEGGPWNSAMPVWESFMSEEEIWNVILFLYDFTGQRPRAVEVHE